MKYFLILCILITGCSTSETQYSKIKTEKIKVDDVIYQPATHGSGSSLGFTTDGSLTISDISINTKAKYFVVFKCVHGKFIVEDSVMWSRVQVNDTGIWHYNEQFKIEYYNGVMTAPPSLEKYNLLDVVINGDSICHKQRL